MCGHSSATMSLLFEVTTLVDTSLSEVSGGVVALCSLGSITSLERLDSACTHKT